MPLGVSFDFKTFITLPVHSLCFTLAFEAVSSRFSVAPTLHAAAAAESTLQSLFLQAQMWKDVCCRSHS